RGGSGSLGIGRSGRSWLCSRRPAPEVRARSRAGAAPGHVAASWPRAEPRSGCSAAPTAPPELRVRLAAGLLARAPRVSRSARRGASGKLGWFRWVACARPSGDPLCVRGQNPVDDALGDLVEDADRGAPTLVVPGGQGDPGGVGLGESRPFRDVGRCELDFDVAGNDLDGAQVPDEVPEAFPQALDLEVALGCLAASRDE